MGKKADKELQFVYLIWKSWTLHNQISFALICFTKQKAMWINFKKLLKKNQN